jgi:hypothetical protein
MNKTFAFLVFFSMLVTSCSTFAPTPTSTPTPAATATLIPTETPMPTATSTPEPPTETPDVVAALLPSGIPDKEWNDIPVMPDAINGEGDSQGYTFTIQADAESIQQYYETELAKLGFQLFATGDGNEKNTILLIFMKDIEIVSISIIPHEDLMIVLIVK